VCGTQTTTNWYGRANGVSKCRSCAGKARYYAAKDIEPSQVRMIDLLHVHPIPPMSVSDTSLDACCREGASAAYVVRKPHVSGAGRQMAPPFATHVGAV
jgi:hypothetical protein